MRLNFTDLYVRDNRGIPYRMLKKFVQQGRSERNENADWEKVRPGVKRLSWRTQGWVGEKSNFFGILLEAKDVEYCDSHEDAVVGKRSERMSFHKREKGCDHDPGDDERHEHPDPKCEIVFLLEDIP